MCYNENAFSFLSTLSAVDNIRLLEGLPISRSMKSPSVS